MPAPARISVPVKQSTPIKPSSNTTPKTPSSIPRTKTRVVHRRRARARLDDTDTDEELVREPHSDSESDSAPSTLDSESLSEDEPEDEPVPDRVPSPSHTPLVNEASISSPSLSSTRAPVFPQSVDWSDMVADENANGVADLPVIDFADFSSHATDAPPPPIVTPSPPPVSHRGESSQGPPSPTQSRKPGQTARQAYLTRLDSDPAYVPTLGQFWSHDDRLLDKDLRSLSGWWRGRWQGRGRGPRGRGGFGGGWGMRGIRGRGGLMNGIPPSFNTEAPVPEEDAPPVERAWTHDGFEEMRKVDEERRQQYQFRSRGTFPRGRGGFRGGFSGRGGFASGLRASSPHGSQMRAQSESQQSSTSDTLKFGDGTRPWFAMKPERVWTKQFDGYLYFEPQLKPVHAQGLGQGVRVKLPGNRDNSSDAESKEGGVVIRLPAKNAALHPVPTARGSVEERAFVVRLPRSKRAGKERADTGIVPEDVTTVAPLPMEETLPSFFAASVPRVQPHLTQEAQSPFPARRVPDAVVSMTQVSTSAVAPLEAEVTPLRRHAPEQISASDNQATAGPSQSQSQPQQEVTQPAEAVPPHSQPPVLPPLQTVAPPFQPSPPYGSPYGYTAPGLPLPPGIAVSESGVTYEIATGRAVYLHTPPPPPPPPPQMQVPMYNPRPMPMHHTHHGSVHFLPPPHHGHGPSMSISPPSFISSPAAGAPIFTLPRQSSRIEIRAPGEERGEKGKEREGALERAGGDARLSGLRTAVNAEPFTPASAPLHAQSQSIGYYTVDGHQAFDEAQQHQQHHQSMPYQPSPYYYLGPDGSANAPYGYGSYPHVDVGQGQQYETYAPDTYSQQATIYY